jgi:acetylglutamate kinase
MPTTPSPFHALRHAAQYVRAFRGKIFVLKIGGELLAEPAPRRRLADQAAVLAAFGIRLVMVHGGGPELDALCARLGLPRDKVAGRRVTPPDVLEAAKMAFSAARTDLVADLAAAGLRCSGLTGADGPTFLAHRRPPVPVLPDDAAEPVTVDFGLVGDLDTVDAGLVNHLLDGGFVPVVTPLSTDGQGQVLNTNADTLAAELAVALGAEKLIFLLGVPGLLRDADRPETLIPFIGPADLEALEAEGAVKAGMRPKLAAARKALAGGVPEIHLVSGLDPDALLVEIFTNEGSGTLLANHEPSGVQP